MRLSGKATTCTARPRLFRSNSKTMIQKMRRENYFSFRESGCKIRLSVSLLLLVAATLTGCPVRAQTQSTSRSTVSSVVDNLCGSGTFSNLTALKVRAYSSAMGGDPSAAILSARDLITLANSCLYGSNSSQVMCDSSASTSCTPSSIVATVVLKADVLYAEDILLQSMNTMNDPNEERVLTEWMRGAGELCKYPGMTLNSAPFTSVRPQLIRALQFASGLAATPEGKKAIVYQLDALRDCARTLATAVSF